MLFVALCIVALFISEIYYLFKLGEFKVIEDSAIKVKDISSVWPENEDKIIFIQGFLRLDDTTVTDE